MKSIQLPPKQSAALINTNNNAFPITPDNVVLASIRWLKVRYTFTAAISMINRIVRNTSNFSS